MFNKLELINEYAICAFAYIMLIFTGLNRPISLPQEQFGKISAFFIILFIFCVNLANLMARMGYGIKLRLR